MRKQKGIMMLGIQSMSGDVIFHYYHSNFIIKLELG